jgi:hypothetical protein
MTAQHQPTATAFGEYLRQLADSRFFGSITLKFEAGQIVHARREENIKPSELSGTPGTQYGNIAKR